MKVRFLRTDEIENAVAELLRNFCHKRNVALSAPVPVEDILEKHLQVKLEIKDLEKMLGIPDVLGAAWFAQGIVRIDERIVDQEGRYCFTLSHELGHWVLHRPQVEAERVTRTLFGPASEAPAFICRTSEKRAPAEWQADQFAARLLMPARLVREAFTATCGNSAIEIDGFAKRRTDADVLTRWREVATTVIDTGKFTNVSNEAMRYRLSDLQLVREPIPSQIIQ
jgi:Zn-dependent peptidase ImmA (M78 family)